MSDPLPDPPVVQGKWSTLNGYTLMYLVNSRMLSWNSTTGDYRISRYDDQATHSDPLPGPPIVYGNWQSIRSGHELVFISGINKLFDWEPAYNCCLQEARKDWRGRVYPRSSWISIAVSVVNRQ
jgi:hypothetical protein